MLHKFDRHRRDCLRAGDNRGRRNDRAFHLASRWAREALEGREALDERMTRADLDAEVAGELDMKAFWRVNSHLGYAGINEKGEFAFIPLVRMKEPIVDFMDGDEVDRDRFDGYYAYKSSMAA